MSFGATFAEALFSPERLAELFALGDFQGARLVLQRGDAGTLDPRSRYFAGKLARLDGEARAHFLAATREAQGAYVDDAAIELAESVYADPRGLYVSARRAFRSFVDRFPGSPYVSLALYRIGRTQMITAGGDSSHIDSARASFELILSKFAGSSESRYAASALREIDGKPWDFGYGIRDVEAQFSADTDVTVPFDAQAENRTVYWVQVGAFSKRALVDLLILRLQGAGLKNRVVDSGKMLLVQVGPYVDRKKAVAVGRHVSLVESLKCQVILE
jgi:hypothetical protein